MTPPFSFIAPDRVATKRADVSRGTFLDRLGIIGFSPVELFEGNKNKIQIITQTTQKINSFKILSAASL